MKKSDIFLLVLLTFLAGFLIGEHNSCPKGKYSYDFGCEVK